MSKPSQGLIPASVIIHVLNEKLNLPNALASVCSRFDEVFVVDAGSTDGTQDIARSHGAQVVQIEGDRTTLVVGSAVMAFEEVCPERIELIHKNYRKLCNLLVDVDEWGQVGFQLNCYYFAWKVAALGPGHCLLRFDLQVKNEAS